MSDFLDIPKPTLSLIISNLIKAKILQSKEGKYGGVRLAKPEDKITLYDLLIAIESSKPLFQTDYKLNVSGKRPEGAKLSVNKILNNIENSVSQQLKKTTLKTILDML
jgi:Rrf2 family protein